MKLRPVPDVSLRNVEEIVIPPEKIIVKTNIIKSNARKYLNY